MSNYEELIKLLTSKNNLFKKKLLASYNEKKKIQKNIENINNHIQENEKELTDKNNNFNEQQEAKIKIAQILSELKTLIIFGIGIGVISGITGLLIAAHFTDNLLPLVITAATTFTTTTSISVASDYFRAKKEMIPYKKIIQQYNESELKSDIENINQKVLNLKLLLMQENDKLEIEKRKTRRIHKRIIRCFMQHDQVKIAEIKAKEVLGDNVTEENINQYFTEDPIIIDTLHLNRKRKIYEKKGRQI